MARKKLKLLRVNLEKDKKVKEIGNVCDMYVTSNIFLAVQELRRSE